MLVARQSAYALEETTRSRRYAFLVTPVIAAGMLALTLALAGHYGLDLRDPDGVIGARLVLLVGVIALFWALDIIPRAVAQAGERPGGLCRHIVAIARERWSWRRAGLVLGSIVAFYIAYLCYRNIKSYVPLVRPELFDHDLEGFEGWVFGSEPAELLHSLLGTGISAHVLSAVYLLFLPFVPISLAFALVWSSDVSAALWWVSAVSLNWVLGLLSYFLVPSLGPAFSSPELFRTLPDTGVTALQQTLMGTRELFLSRPADSGLLQSIAAFASLHVAVVFTGAVMAWMLKAPRPLRLGLWIYLALTTLATIYLGWHYVVDDLAGFMIGGLAVYLSALLTGWRIQREPRHGVPALQRA